MNIPLSLSPQDIEIVLQGLGELQFKVSANVFMKIRGQRDEAMRSVPDAAPKGD